ncbi:pyrroline-5-carboxylate reductase [Microcella putealis]|uniref:Pyrroline-5-carboxylate reductase n=1 Tax=Microcella putealis TaxID=337005 RepID=A0A4Q7LQH0_9MICO|nr:pyrroline-5-carboxylate reductase [Microcella putealis]RZS56412.1 pyrroline-5-carboxylate reductase [Microcella putealis]TQM27102.1 pyrroline-5-carboxylate reductase [Microcella putealis]
MSERAPLPPIAIIGTGSMGGAILSGLRRPVEGADPVPVRVTTRSEASAAALRAEGVDARAIEHDSSANAWAVEGAGVVVLGVKPAQIVDVLAELAPSLDADALVISVAAGITTATMEAAAPNPVVRAMPNTPSLVGRGVTGVSAGSRATAAHLTLADDLFRLVGTVVELPESQIDALSTISGSGPAYVFLLIEEFTKAAQAMGFDEDVARLMAEQTFIGATRLLEASGDDPEELRRQVTSPKGTTERAVAVLQGAELDRLFARAAEAALARARELAAGS